MVILNLRKKDWLDAKSQICFPGSKFAFPRTWPWSKTNLERGHVFSFSIFAIPMQICVFPYKGWQWRRDFSITFSASIHTMTKVENRDFALIFFRRASFQYPFISKPFRNSNSYHEFLSPFGTRNAHLKFSVSYHNLGFSKMFVTLHHYPLYGKTQICLGRAKIKKNKNMAPF